MVMTDHTMIRINIIINQDIIDKKIMRKIKV
jgi:hypothetical protein